MIFDTSLHSISFTLSALLFLVYFILDLGAFPTGPINFVSDFVRRDREVSLAREKKASALTESPENR